MLPEIDGHIGSLVAGAIKVILPGAIIFFPTFLMFLIIFLPSGMTECMCPDRVYVS